jgi:hypothetical protein
MILQNKDQFSCKHFFVCWQMFPSMADPYSPPMSSQALEYFHVKVVAIYTMCTFSLTVCNPYIGTISFSFIWGFMSMSIPLSQNSKTDHDAQFSPWNLALTNLLCRTIYGRDIRYNIITFMCLFLLHHFICQSPIWSWDRLTFSKCWKFILRIIILSHY